MKNSLYTDLESVIKDIKLNKLGASFFLFGSSANNNIDKKRVKDVDIAILIPPESKSEALNQLCKIAKKPKRKLNWNIDVYTPNSPTFGYNGRSTALLHLFIIDQDELASDSYFSDSIKIFFKKITSENLDEISNGRK